MNNSAHTANRMIKLGSDFYLYRDRCMTYLNRQESKHWEAFKIPGVVYGKDVNRFSTYEEAKTWLD